MQNKKGGVNYMNIVTITEENKEAFESLIPDGYELLGRNQYALGAVDDADEENFAVGLLHFYLESGTSNGEEMNMAIVDWIYVDAKYRRQGYAAGLLGALNEKIDYVNASDSEDGISGIICDIPKVKDYDSLGDFLHSSGFISADVELPNAYFPLGEVLEKLNKNSKNVVPDNLKPLADISPVLLAAYLSKIDEIVDIYRDTSIDILDYDGQASTVSIDSETGEIDGAFLLKRVGIANMLETIFLYSKDKQLSNDMLVCSVLRGSKIYGPDQIIKVPGVAEGTAKLVSFLLPDLKLDIVRRFSFDIIDNDNENENNKNSKNSKVPKVPKVPKAPKVPKQSKAKEETL
jgi:GNAT superfamily N-acetyltransferase